LISSFHSTLIRSEKIRFGSLEFITTTDSGLQAGPIAAPLQAIHFGSLDFVADYFGALQLSTKERTRLEGAATSPSVGGTERDGLGFVGVADYTLPSLHDIPEGGPDNYFGSEAGTDECDRLSRECNMVDEVNRTSVGGLPAATRHRPSSRLSSWRRIDVCRLNAYRPSRLSLRLSGRSLAKREPSSTRS